jgi:hypothetical protein
MPTPLPADVFRDRADSGLAVAPVTTAQAEEAAGPTRELVRLEGEPHESALRERRRATRLAAGLTEGPAPATAAARRANAVAAGPAQRNALAHAVGAPAAALAARPAGATRLSRTATLANAEAVLRATQAFVVAAPTGAACLPRGTAACTAAALQAHAAAGTRRTRRETGPRAPAERTHAASDRARPLAAGFSRRPALGTHAREADKRRATGGARGSATRLPEPTARHAVPGHAVVGTGLAKIAATAGRLRPAAARTCAVGTLTRGPAHARHAITPARHAHLTHAAPAVPAHRALAAALAGASAQHTGRTGWAGTAHEPSVARGLRAFTTPLPLAAARDAKTAHARGVIARAEQPIAAASLARGAAASAGTLPARAEGSARRPLGNAPIGDTTSPRRARIRRTARLPGLATGRKRRRSGGAAVSRRPQGVPRRLGGPVRVEFATGSTSGPTRTKEYVAPRPAAACRGSVARRIRGRWHGTLADCDSPPPARGYGDEKRERPHQRASRRPNSTAVAGPHARSLALQKMGSPDIFVEARTLYDAPLVRE